MASTRPEALWSRMIELGLEDLIGAFKTKGMNTFAKFGFGCDYTPHGGDPAKLTEDLLKPLAGETPEHVMMLRMLWWESWGIATADMQRSAAGGTEARKLGAPELKARREETLKKLSGLTITPELDISDQLLSDCVSIVDGNRMKYIPWESCTARSLEITGQKKDTTWTADSNGFLRCESADPENPAADTASDYNLDLAFKRRGLAMDMADLMSWPVHEKLRQDLMSAMTRPQPPGYQKISKQQLKRADEVAFGLLAKIADGGVKRKGGKLPLDEALEQVLNHRDYNLALQPLPGGTKREQDSSSSSSRQPPNKEARLSQADRQLLQKALAAQAGSSSTKGGGKGSKGKGKGKKGGGNPFLPQELRLKGATPQDDQGNPICFRFNSAEGCNDAGPGGKCPKGRHVCMMYGCRKNHAMMVAHRGQ